MSGAGYAPVHETDEGRKVFTVTGGDWEEALADRDPVYDERIIINMGPQHPSTHGVLRLVLELEGETVTDIRLVVGYLHTGIEKNLEYRTWTQGTTFVTRMDYLSPIINEAGYCLAVEKLLGITDQIPDRANVIRVLMMELNRISSHLVWIATTGMELGALSIMTYGFRDREKVLDIFEMASGLRMNMAYIRPGGLAQDFPDEAVRATRELIPYLTKRLDEYEAMLSGNPIWRSRTVGVAELDVTACLALGVTGPVLRSAGLGWDLRKTMPYCGYETYDFEVPTRDEGDVYARYEVRMAEMRESMKIVQQCLDRLEPGPVMVADKKIAWPAQLAVGNDGLGNSLGHVANIMGQSMEALIHHFKLVTEGFRVPPGQVYVQLESPRGELGVHAVSDGGTRPYRVHFREPSFVNLQCIPAMAEGGLISDVIAGGASLDPVMGGCDR
ncbi:NADH-quinone oxidoreductase subunit D [Natronosporangium hydrolyticum]|uniref:NADH-quinone oxidoreductase subunit D n=1 Tax=Natronosporangium hydrolyticum TaxID=2811111 RepID=A0A895YDT6_9ACTN|nr:NADH-quinone oxidoreductase subunit D [Natronosporangium hydrolyticum]QSB14345.1 NADH-quinone oxidoreductase subunit D [Natronosporangium hydrolyticum]